MRSRGESIFNTSTSLIDHAVSAAIAELICGASKYCSSVIPNNNKPDLKGFLSSEAILCEIELYRMIKNSQHMNVKKSVVFKQFYVLGA